MLNFWLLRKTETKVIITKLKSTGNMYNRSATQIFGLDNYPQK